MPKRRAPPRSSTPEDDSPLSSPLSSIPSDIDTPPPTVLPEPPAKIIKRAQEVKEVQKKRATRGKKSQEAIEAVEPVQEEGEGAVEEPVKAKGRPKKNDKGENETAGAAADQEDSSAPINSRKRARKAAVVDYNDDKNDDDDENDVKHDTATPQDTTIAQPSTAKPPKGKKAKLSSTTTKHEQATVTLPSAPSVPPSREEATPTTTTTTSTKRKPKVKAETSTKSPRKKKVKKEEEEAEAGEEGSDGVEEGEGKEGKENKSKVKRRRKTKEEKEREAMPLAERVVGVGYMVGAHVSSAKGVQNAVTNALHIGGNAFALFLKSQRKWENPALKDEDVDKFHELSGKLGYDVKKHVLPHGSYLVNLANIDAEKAKKSYDGFLDDLQRSEKLGIGLFNFHPGSTAGEPRHEAITRLAKQLNRAHKETSFVKTVLENMANQNTILGGRFEDLRDVIQQIDDKDRVGVCLDTCHSFAAGYDLRSPETFKNVLEEFDKIVGMKYLSALHLNDSKTPLGSGRDLHENIGVGFLGLRAFWNIMNEPRFKGMPLILETPYPEAVGVKQWAEEIKLLESLTGMDTASETFLKLERELADKGADARKIAQEKFDKKQAEKEKEKDKPKKTRKSKVSAKADGNIKAMFTGGKKAKGKKGEDVDQEEGSEDGNESSAHESGASSGEDEEDNNSGSESESDGGDGSEGDDDAEAKSKKKKKAVAKPKQATKAKVAKVKVAVVKVVKEVKEVKGRKKG